MKNILIIGAGRSSGALIKYVLDSASENDWKVTVADSNLQNAEQKIGGHPNGNALELDASNGEARRAQLQKADMVVSLLPAHLHIEVARDCLDIKRHLLTASYMSTDMYALSDRARQEDLIFMGEIGLDPGIDHMSAMQKFDEIREAGGELTGFRSYTGGLVAPESDDNPWHYKISWNPANVVRAGQGTAQYLSNGKYKYIPYNRLFKDYEPVNILGEGMYEVYANRDSLLYREKYGLGEITNLFRGTLRHRGFCEAWHALVSIGLTDDTYQIVESEKLSCHDLLEAYMPTGSGNENLKERVSHFLNVPLWSDIMQKLEWLGLFDQKPIEIKNATPAEILQNLLLEKWSLKPQDKDRVIMQHEFDYKIEGRTERLISTMVHDGNDANDTAMSRLVGLPLGIFMKLVLQGKVHTPGVQIPTGKEVYEPVLKELEDHGVVFKEQVINL